MSFFTPFVFCLTHKLAIIKIFQFGENKGIKCLIFNTI